MRQNKYKNGTQFKIVRRRVDSLSLYEVTADELTILEKGPPNSISLNFTISLLSISISFLISILTVPIPSIKLFTVFIVLAIVSFIAGLFLLASWFRTRNSLTAVVKKIKQRIPTTTVSSR